jgi:type II secretory pathway component PulC
MFLSLQTLGKIILGINVLLTGGVIVAGGSLFMADTSPSERAPGAFEKLRVESGTPEKREEDTAFDDFKDITVDRFINIAQVPQKTESPASHMPVPVPGLDSAAKNAFRVKGIMLSSIEDFTFAVVEIQRTKEQVTVRAGDKVEGIDVVRIETDAVVIRIGVEECDIPLDITDEGGGRAPAPIAGKAKKGKGKKSAGKKSSRKSGSSSRSSGSSRRAEMARRAAEMRKRAGASAPPSVKPEEVPKPSELKGLSKEEIIKKLPPRLQQWWAKLPPDEKKKWEDRFRKKYGKYLKGQ